MGTLKDILARNLIYLRKKNNLTQNDLAAKINYSDNAISRWERGEVTPSIEILEKLAHFYGIKVQDLLDENFQKNFEDGQTSHKLSRVLTITFCMSVVWFIIIIAYIYLNMIAGINAWILFVVGLPVSCAVALYFNNRWGNRVMSVIIASVLIWTIIASVYLWFLQYNLWLLFLLGIPSQSGLVTWYFLKPIRLKKLKSL
jgi:transcriptional regulator with XRE-family HTH domain